MIGHTVFVKIKSKVYQGTLTLFGTWLHVERKTYR